MHNIDPNFHSCDRNFPSICMPWLLPDPPRGESFNCGELPVPGRRTYIRPRQVLYSVCISAVRLLSFPII